jgi:hypothetical protein
VKVSGQGGLAERASRKLIGEELLLPQYSGVRLKMDMDRVPLWRGNHVLVKELVENMAQYLYLPRLTNRNVLINAIQDGLVMLNWREDTFAFAHDYDADANRYKGLIAGSSTQVVADHTALLVKPEIAVAQLEKQEADRVGEGATGGLNGGSTGGGGGTCVGVVTGEEVDDEPVVVDTKPKRFFGSVTLDATRIGRDAGRIATEVLSHLTGLNGSNAEVTLEIQVEIPEGVEDNVVRTVTENCRTLKFDSQGFESE